MVLVNDHLDHELGSEIRGAGYAKEADKAALDALAPAALAVGEIRTTVDTGRNWEWDGAEWRRHREYIGISIHEYGPGVGQGNSTVDDAAFAWLAANHSGRPWLLRGGTDYNITASIDISGVAGQQILGGSREGTRIRSSNLTSPILIVGGARGQKFADFTCIYTSQATDAGAIGIRVENDTTFMTISDVLVWYSTRGLALNGAVNRRFFSNRIESLEIRGWSDWAMHLDGLGGSSGNEWGNIYLNNNDGGPQSATGVLYMKDQNDNSWGQLNIEACVVTGTHAVILEESQCQSVASLHCEQVTLAGDTGLVQCLGFGTGINIGAMRVHDCVGSGTSSYFFVSPNNRVDVGLLDSYGTTGFDYIFDGPFWVDSSNTRIGVGKFFDNTNNGGAALLGPVGSTLSENLLREYNGHTFLPRFTTAGRPTPFRVGQQILDTDLGHPITWNGSNWVDGVGTTV